MTRQLGRYSILHELGAGWTGAVYRARDEVMGRDVALKVIPDFASLDPEPRQRFYREARAGAKLKHQNIVTVFDFGEESGAAFISMEFLRGSDLAALLSILQRYGKPIHFKGGKPLTAVARMEIIAGVCDGLQHAHERDIIHRDIKPSNIFVTEDGIPKILDFGAAHLPASTLTVTGRILGTPHYMAPEQIRAQHCDRRTDIFSLAIVAFEFLTGAHPFFSKWIPDRIVNDPPDSLLQRNPQLPAELEEVIARGLEKDPARRYQTAAEFGAALRIVARDVTRNAPAPPPGTQQPAQPSPAAQSGEIRRPDAARTDYDLAELLSALSEFDDAVQRRDAARARQAFTAVQRIVEGDPRFSSAILESEARLLELERSEPAVPVRSGNL